MPRSRSAPAPGHARRRDAHPTRFDVPTDRLAPGAAERGDRSSDPQPSSTAQANTELATPDRHDHRRCTPATPTRRSPRGPERQQRAKIVGTPAVACLPPRPNALRGSKRASNDSDAPTPIAAFSVHVWPNEWNSGKPPKITSSGPSWSSSLRVTSAFAVRLPCVSSAPFGRPVVPDVYSNTAVSSTERSMTGHAGSVAASRSANDVGPTGTTPASAWAAPASTSSRVQFHAKIIGAPESLR